MKKLLKPLGVASVLLLILSELSLQWFLGEAALSITHPQIEYMFAPNQDIVRFGNRIQINSHGMRSPELRQHAGKKELRVMVLGDSVINGGNITDQESLATEVLRRELSKKLEKTVTVMNVSAGSWGPPNLMAYVAEKGIFDADLAITVVSSHDYRDVPTFAPLNPLTHPTRQTFFATQEAAQRYLPQILWRLRGTPSARPSPPTERDILACTSSLAKLQNHLRSHLKFAPAVVLHATQEEIAAGEYSEGGRTLREAATSNGTPVHEDFTALKNYGSEAFRDNIHLQEQGHAVLGQVLTHVALRHLKLPTSKN